MKITVITVAYNMSNSIENTIFSVASQNYDDVEHIIVDGGSTDGTREIIERHADKLSAWISEPDQGVYDAMNKGIAMATGDVIGFLNADDIYAHKNVLSHAAATFGKGIEACYADLVYVRDDLEIAVRYYRSRRFAPERLVYGWMPAHPTLFLRHEVFEQYGEFKTNYKIAADFELCARLFGKHGVTARYVPEVWVKMRMGGISTQGIKSNILLSREIVRACRENGIKTNLFKVCLKYPRKMLELITRPL